jgi:hypothetical protein
MQHLLSAYLPSARSLLYPTQHRRLLPLSPRHPCHGTCLAQLDCTIRRPRPHALRAPEERLHLLVISPARRVPQVPILILQVASQAAQIAKLENSHLLAPHRAHLAPLASTRPRKPPSALNAQHAPALNTKQAPALLRPTLSVKNAHLARALNISPLNALLMLMQSAVHAKRAQQQSTGRHRALESPTRSATLAPRAQRPSTSSQRALQLPILSVQHAPLALVVNISKHRAALRLTQFARPAQRAMAKLSTKQQRALPQLILSAPQEALMEL